eukprot:COSAG02_NODE_28342_length_591_cov_1.130081_1_plen_26_part_10
MRGEDSKLEVIKIINNQNFKKMAGAL